MSDGTLFTADVVSKIWLRCMAPSVDDNDCYAYENDEDEKDEDSDYDDNVSTCEEEIHDLIREDLDNIIQHLQVAYMLLGDFPVHHTPRVMQKD